MRFLRALFLCGVGFGALVAGKPQVGQPAFSARSVAVMVPRGGAGPLDPNLVAKSNCVLHMINGAFMYLAPSKAAEVYKFPATARNCDVAESLGAGIFSFALVTTAIVFYSQSLESAVAIGSIPFLVRAIRRLLNNSNPSSDDIINALISTGLLYGSLQNTSWNTDFIKYLTYFQLANGIVGGLAPSLLSKLWGQGENMSDETITLVRSILMWVLSSATIQHTLLNNKSIELAIGMSCIPQLVNLLSILFVDKKSNDPAVNKVLYACLAIYSIVAGTLAL